MGKFQAFSPLPARRGADTAPYLAPVVLKNRVQRHPSQRAPAKQSLIVADRVAKLRPLFMADIANTYPDNITGKYFVDNQCIDCDLCRETAPANYKRSDDGGYSFVYKQPENPEEEARCKEAKEGCPVEAIGDNGA